MSNTVITVTASKNEFDISFDEKALADLNRYWGESTQANLGKLKETLQAGPAGLFEGLLTARMPDDSALLNNAEILRFLYTLDQTAAHLRALHL